MVLGIDSFREKFKDYTEYYTIIGGTACDILLTEADLPFRATKDIDMILIMEDNFPEFAAIFWEYIKEGVYKCGWKNAENIHFYRFTEGRFGYPTMIELFSRKPGYHLEIEEGIIYDRNIIRCWRWTGRSRIADLKSGQNYTKCRSDCVSVKGGWYRNSL